MGWHRWDGRRWAVVRPKTPRGDENFSTARTRRAAASSESSDPKPREGTRTAFHLRQVDVREVAGHVVRPKTPRGDENTPCFSTARTRRAAASSGRELLSVSASIRVVRSSDPKPREGTRTGEMREQRDQQSWGRQTQNPARGREPEGASTKVCVRWSSDPKPREGTRTCGGTASRGCPRWSRQTQNPARGRELNAQLGGHVNEVGVSSDPKPREGTRTLDIGNIRPLAPDVVRPKTPRGDENLYCSRVSVFADFPSRQTQNPARGREHDRSRQPSGCDRISRQTQNPARGREPHVLVT